jgi:hypothetical protein
MLIGFDALSDKDQQLAISLGLVQINKPLIDNLYIIARERSTQERKATTLRELIGLANLTNILPATSDTQLYTVTHAKQEFYDTIVNSKDELKKKLRQNILNANDSYQKSIMVGAKVDKAESFSGLLATVGSVVTAAGLGVTKAVTVSLTNLINKSVADAALTNRLFTGSANVKVYKTVISDGRLCQWCEAFYIDKKTGKPKVYELSELAANGSNYGKPKSQWKAVVGATHVGCRCQLHYGSPDQKSR